MKSIQIALKMLVLTLIFGLIINNVNAQQTIYVGFRVPQMTEADRLLIGAETFSEHARGQMIKNLETNTLQYWNGKEWICLESKEAILEYVVNNFSQALGDTILNFLTHNLTEEFVDSIMVKVTIEGETGIIVEGSGTRHITVRLPDASANNDVLAWTGSGWEAKSIGDIITSDIVISVTSNLSGLSFGTNTSTTPVLTIVGSPSPGQFLAFDGAWQTPANDNTTYTAGFGLDLNNTEFSANARDLADSLVSMIVNNRYQLGDEILKFIAENISNTTINLGDTIMQYITNNFSQALGDTILNFLTHNLTEQFVDSVMAKVIIEGETGIIVEGSGTRHITVKLPEGLNRGDLLVWDSTEWQPKTPAPVWFYMPSIVIDVSQNRTDTIINLYDEYLRQFLVSAPQSRIVGSGPPLNTAVRVYERDQLHFYVIGYDNTVFTIHEITEEGEMRFDINAANVSEETFMNIIFVVR